MNDLPDDLAKPKRKPLNGDTMGIIVGAALILVLLAMIAFVAVT